MDRVQIGDGILITHDNQIMRLNVEVSPLRVSILDVLKASMFEEMVVLPIRIGEWTIGMKTVSGGRSWGVARCLDSLRIKASYGVSGTSGAITPVFLPNHAPANPALVPACPVFTPEVGKLLVLVGATEQVSTRAPNGRFVAHHTYLIWVVPAPEGRVTCYVPPLPNIHRNSDGSMCTGTNLEVDNLAVLGDRMLSHIENSTWNTDLQNARQREWNPAFFTVDPANADRFLPRTVGGPLEGFLDRFIGAAEYAPVIECAAKSALQLAMGTPATPHTPIVPPMPATDADNTMLDENEEENEGENEEEHTDGR